MHCVVINKTIIPLTLVGYELLDSGGGAEHRVGYHKLISNKREWNNCFIKYHTVHGYQYVIFHERAFISGIIVKYTLSTKLSVTDHLLSDYRFLYLIT